MQIVINRQDLLSILKRSGAAINSGDMVSVRQCVLFSATDASSAITCATTDGQLDITIQAKGEVKAPGACALNHHRLAAIVNELPEGYVEISVDGKFKATVRSSASKRKFSMTALDPVDFPKVTSAVEPETWYSVEAKILLQAASEVSFAIDSKLEETPSGALLMPKEDKFFELAAVTGHSFALAKGWFSEARQSNQNYLLPKNLLDALKTVPKDQIIELAQDNTHLFARAPGISIRALPLHRPFPVQVVPLLVGCVPQKRRFRVSSEALLESVRAVSAGSDFVEGKDKFVQIDLTYADGIVRMATRKSEKGQGEDEIGVEDADPRSFQIHFDANYMATALKSFVPTEIDFYFDIVNDRPSCFLRNETLLAMVLLIDEIAAPPAKGSKP